MSNTLIYIENAKPYSLQRRRYHTFPSQRDPLDSNRISKSAVFNRYTEVLKATQDIDKTAKQAGR